MDNIKISVCMTTYNGSEYIEEQISSILLQLQSMDELILVDDQSIDNTLEIVENFNDSRIKIIPNKTNIGVVKSFEKAIQETSGDIIFLSDQDDIWLPNKVQEVIDCFSRENCLAVITDATLVNSHGEVFCESFFKFRESGSGIIKNYYKNTYIGCCMAISSKVKPYIIPFPKKTPMHDQWIGLVCNCIGKVIFLEKSLLLYRRHQNNLTGLSRSKWKIVIYKRLVWGRTLIATIPKIYIRYLLSNTL